MTQKRVLLALLFITFSWAAVATFLYLNLKNNPEVVTIAEGGKLVASNQLKDSERTAFIRQFIEGYFTFTSDNFLQSQTSLTNLMSADLRQRRISEINRRGVKSEQKATIYSITQDSNNSYTVEVEIKFPESSKEEPVAYKAKLQLEQVPKSIQNPWAISVSKTDFKHYKPVAVKGLAFKIKSPTTIVLNTPCAVENIVNPDDKLLKIRTTTITTSEIQISSVARLKAMQKVRLACEKLVFDISIEESDTTSDQFALLPLSLSKEKEKPKVIVPKVKTKYELLMEESLKAQ